VAKTFDAKTNIDRTDRRRGEEDCSQGGEKGSQVPQLEVAYTRITGKSKKTDKLEKPKESRARGGERKE